MATFGFNIVERDDFSIEEKSLLETECSSQYVYSVYSENETSISISLNGDFLNNSSVSVNGYEEYWDGLQKTIEFTGVVEISFNIGNSGRSSYFNEVQLTINEDGGDYFDQKFTRNNDSPKCEDLAPAETYDQLNDTPENKFGSSLKFIRVNEDETMHEYVSLEGLVKNIYNADGILDSNRIVNLNENNLTFSGSSGDEEFTVSDVDGFLINNAANVEINDALGVTINSLNSGISTEQSNSLKMGSILFSMDSNDTSTNEESIRVSFQESSTTPDNKKGIEYGEDYTLNWDEDTPDNIIPTKGYVDRELSGLSGDNIYNSDGTLESNRFIQLSDKVLYFQGDDSNEVVFQRIDNFVVNGSNTIEFDARNKLDLGVTSGAASLTITDDSVEEKIVFSFKSESRISDNKKGVEYNEDYTLLWDISTPSNLLTTKGYVDRKVFDFVDKTGDTMTGLLQTPVVQEKTLVVTSTPLGQQGISWSDYTNWDITLTNNTFLTSQNPPPSGYSQTITIYVKGDYALTLPSEWIIIGGSYDPAGTQFIVQSWDDGNFYCAIGGGEIDLSIYLQKSGGNIDGNLNVSGNVGIGTTNPQSQLEISQDTNEIDKSFRVKNKASGNSAFIWIDDNDRMRIDNAGNSSRPVVINGDGSGGLILGSLQTFANNAAASSLASGTIYRTLDGTLKIKS